MLTLVCKPNIQKEIVIDDYATTCLLHLWILFKVFIIVAFYFLLIVNQVKKMLYHKYLRITYTSNFGLQNSGKEIIMYAIH